MSEDQKKQSEEEGFGAQGRPESQSSGPKPEPPAGWMPQSTQGQPRQRPQAQQLRAVVVGKETFTVSETDLAEFESARKFCVAAQIVALVSLFIGGVLLSTIAVVLAIIGYRKLAGVAAKMPEESVRRALRRSGIIAIVLSALALVLNIVSLIVLLPMLGYIAQTGDYSAIFGGSAAPSSGTSTTWG